MISLTPGHASIACLQSAWKSNLIYRAFAEVHHVCMGVWINQSTFIQNEKCLQTSGEVVFVCPTLSAEKSPFGLPTSRSMLNMMLSDGLDVICFSSTWVRLPVLYSRLVDPLPNYLWSSVGLEKLTGAIGWMWHLFGLVFVSLPL